MKRSLSCGILVLLLVATAGADVVFNTLGPGNTYDQSNAFTVSGPASSAGNTFESAAQFVAAAGGALTQIDLGLTLRDGGAVDVYLYGNAGGSPDNLSQILLGTVTPTQAFGTTNNSIVSFVPAGNVTVNQGSTYWLVLKPDDATTRETWNRSLGVAGMQDVSTNDSTWVQSNTTLAAFRISSVPEPRTVAMSLLVLGFLVGRRLLRFIRLLAIEK